MEAAKLYNWNHLKVHTSAIISAETTPVSSMSSLLAAVLRSSPSFTPPCTMENHYQGTQT